MRELFITRPMPESVINAARAQFDVTLRAQTTPLKKGEMRAALVLYDVVLPTLGDMFSAEVFEGLSSPRCKLLANFGMGYNHIDVAAARAAGVAVTNTPGAVTESTADIALMLILMSARRAGEGERLVRSGKWQGWHPTQMLGMHLGGRTCGIIGMGKIGQAVQRRVRLGLGMKVVYHNRSPRPVEGATQLEDIAAVMAMSDVVVVAVPGGAETHHLISAPELRAMKRHAHLINISRGDVIDEDELIAALHAGRIGGAGMDVYEFEPDVPEALRELENVVLLPHLGTAAENVRVEMGMMALENARAMVEGRALINPV